MTKMPDALLALIGTYIDHYVANLDSFRMAEKLDRAVRTGLVRITLSPREIVASGWLAAHGVVSLVSSSGLPAGKVHFSVQELRSATRRVGCWPKAYERSLRGGSREKGALSVTLRH